MESKPKKIKRWESKKRKVEAFLELTKDNPLVTSSEKHQQNEDCAIPSKKAKTDSDEDSSDDDVEAKLQTQLEALRAEKHARQKAMMQKPKIYTTLENLQVPNKQPQAFAMFSLPETEPRYLPLFIMDLQHLLLYATQGNAASYKPRWCKLLRVAKVSHVIVLVLNNVSVTEYSTFPDCFPYIKSAFQMKAEMISPTEYASTVYEELLTVPVSNSQVRRQIKDLTWKQAKKTETQKGTAVAVSVEMPEEINKPQLTQGIPDFITDVEFNRVHLLLSPQQMIQEDYPLPVNAENTPGYAYSNMSYTEVQPNSPLYAVDCEMCMTDQRVLELTRVSIVDENLEVVYDTLVKPYNKIISYLTKYSGITKNMLENVTTRLENVQKTIQEIISADAILCGQSLNGDLHTLKLYHPYVIDTSVIYNLAGVRGMKPGLKRLAAHFLNKEIQTGKKGHSPVEDATTTMELVKLKLNKGHTFGDVTLGGVVFPSQEDKPSVTEKLDLKLAADSLKDNKNEKIPSVNSNATDSNVVDVQEELVLKPCEGCQNCKPIKSKTNESESSDDEEIAEEPNNKNDKKSCNNCVKNHENIESKSSTSDSSKTLGKKDNVSSGTACDVKDTKLDGQISDVKMCKKTVFFKRPGSSYARNFFHLSKESKKSVTLIGDCPEFGEKLLEVENGLVSHKAASSDQKTAKHCKKSLCASFVTMASFNEFTPDSTIAEQQEELLKLDKHVKKVLEDVPENALVSLVLGGHSDPANSHKALCFVKIT